MEKETKNKIVTIALAAVLLAACMAVEHFCRIASWQLLLLYLVPFLLAGAETLKEAAEGLFEGGVLEEDFLMSIATIGALGIGFLPGTEPQFAEAVFVMLFFQVGELFEDLAEGKSRRSISHLLDIRPDSACVLRDGVWTQVSPNTVEVGETIIVRPGEKVPMDGLVLKGESDLDTAALTGESVPRRIYAGEEIFSGTINISAPLEIRVTRLFGESTASRILELVENAASNKSSGERFITRFARVYTPVVAGLAVLLAVVPPLLSGDFGGVFHIWLYRALTFLIVSCPCALVISVPLAFFSGIGRASRRGILVKGGNWLEVLSRTGTVVFDKTGTLTEGVFEVTAIHPEKLSERELLHIAAHVEKHSSHPVAMSLKRAFDMDGDDGCSVEQIEEIPGKGARATVNGKSVYVGNTRLMDELGVEWKACEKTGTVIHIASDGEYEGHIVISDRIKEGAKDALDELRSLGVHDMVMLTGDNSDTAVEVAGELGLSGFRAELLPEGKVSELRGLLDGKAEGESLAFAGDGINDAPVLALADVGIAMGALGSDAAIEAADVVLMDDKLSRLGEAIRIARKTVGVARQNTVFTIAVKLAVLVLASFGLAPMGLAVFADVGVTVLAVLNSSRL